MSWPVLRWCMTCKGCVANTMYVWHCVIYGIQEAFAGRTKTILGPHTARVPLFGPRCYELFRKCKKITLVPLRLRLFVNKSILAPFLFRKFTKDSSRSPLLQSSSCTPLTGISSAMEIRAASASSGVRRKFSWGGSFSGIWCSYVFGLSCLWRHIHVSKPKRFGEVCWHNMHILVHALTLFYVSLHWT